MLAPLGGPMSVPVPKDPWPDPPDLPHVCELFAGSEIDVGELRHLVELGCPPDMIASVLL